LAFWVETENLNNMSPPIIDFSYLPNMLSPYDIVVFDGLPPAKATDGYEFVFEDGVVFF